MYKNLIYRKYFETNKQGKDYIVPDIHGNYNAFLEILHNLNFNFEKDRVFSLGDIIDKGQENLECLSLLDQKWFTMILGNHEAIHLAKFFKFASDNGTKWSKNLVFKQDTFNGISSYEYYKKKLQKLEQSPLSIFYKDKENDLKLGFVHAQFEENLFFNEERKIYMNRTHVDLLNENMLWNRDIFNNKKSGIVQDLDFVFCGHTITEDFTLVDNHCFMDSGFFEGNYYLHQDMHKITQTKKERIEIEKEKIHSNPKKYESKLNVYDIKEKKC